MKLNQYKQFFKDEWEFHKRNPEMFFVWAGILISIGYCLIKFVKEN